MVSQKKLPEILIHIKEFLKTVPFKLNETEEDGRSNSAISERIIINAIKILIKDSYIKVPNIRSWYDILLYDTEYGWIPVNIKITTTTTADNIGNLACCVQAFTDYILDLERTYENGPLSNILIDSFKNKRYNTNPKKDYFCLVINKNSLITTNLITNNILENDIIINSILSISKFTSNCNNLPFQIKWSKNRVPINIDIIQQVKKFQDLFKTIELPWSTEFINNMKNLNDSDSEIIVETIADSDVISVCSSNPENYDYDMSLFIKIDEDDYSL